MSIKLGTAVRQVMPAPVTGIVVRKQFDDTSDSFQYLVEWPAGEGEAPHQRWFNEGELEAQPTEGEAA